MSAVVILIIIVVVAIAAGALLFSMGSNKASGIPTTYEQVGRFTFSPDAPVIKVLNGGKIDANELSPEEIYFLTPLYPDEMKAPLAALEFDDAKVLYNLVYDNATVVLDDTGNPTGALAASSAVAFRYLAWHNAIYQFTQNTKWRPSPFMQTYWTKIVFRNGMPILQLPSNTLTVSVDGVGADAGMLPVNEKDAVATSSGTWPSGGQKTSKMGAMVTLFYSADLSCQEVIYLHGGGVFVVGETGRLAASNQVYCPPGSDELVYFRCTAPTTTREIDGRNFLIVDKTDVVFRVQYSLVKQIPLLPIVVTAIDDPEVSLIINFPNGPRYTIALKQPITTSDLTMLL